MARDFPGTHRVAQRPHPDFFLPASRSLPHPRGKPPAAAKASEASAPARTPPGSLRAPPNNAKPPRSATLPARISRSIVFGTCREGMALRPAAESPEWVSPSPAVLAILPAILAPSNPFLSRRRVSTRPTRPSHYSPTPPP